jgi:transposase
MCELLEKMSKLGLKKPVTIVLDNARYQRNAFVMELAEELGIELLFLPSYSPNLNLIERLWRLIKRTALYGRYYANFKLFKAAIEKTIDELHTVHREKLESMMTLKFQTFKEVLLLAA